MPESRDRKTPGVYVTEIPAFPPSGVGVATAIPAFVGYTERAEICGRPCFNKPIPLDSIDEYSSYFGGAPKPTFRFGEGSAEDFDVRFANIDVSGETARPAESYRTLTPSGQVGLLYHSLNLFYANGGGRCFVVSVGTYGAEVDWRALKAGVEALEDQAGPTMLVVPDLSLLGTPAGLPAVPGFKDVAAAMLDQCRKKQDRVALLDVVHARGLTRRSTTQDRQDAIERFRADVDHEHRSYGIAYYPHLDTSKLNRLPASAAMAGVMTFTDAARGVWSAPANVALASVDAPGVIIDDDVQADLDEPPDGKAINVIRDFVGRGPVVGGARTLDGNRNHYRYVQVRRTLIYIEESVKAALSPFVFAPNEGRTWVNATSIVSNFLQDLWARGGLMGATAREAFSVDCGLSTTMTSRDVLEGYMIVRVLLQMIHPAEFVELTFKQKMENVG